jgi:ribosomal protein S18 acetylase RimI-like enzyme
MDGVRLERLGPADADRVEAASELFDRPPQPAWTTKFLASEGHHLCIAFVDDVPVGFVTGVEMTHPDKGTEMFLYELGVTESHRRRGIGRALVAELLAIARERSCTGLWVATEPDNVAAVATYRSAGSATPEPSAVLSWAFDLPSGD